MKQLLLFFLVAIFSFAANAQVCFQLDSVYATSGTVTQPVLAGFNNDGNLDMAAISYDSSCVRVRLGIGSGNFGTAIKYTTGVNSRPTGIAVADFNEDGNMDIITSCDNNRVAMLLGNGSGGFGAPTQFTGGSTPRSITVADFNNDGNVDVAIAYWIQSSGNNIGRWLGDGAGGLASFTQFSIFGYSYMQSIRATDFNKDGNMDISTVVNTSLNQFFVMLGNGTGGFGAASAFPTGAFPFGVAVGDYNGDTIPDLAIGTGTGSNYYISIHIGNGSGGFSAKTDFAVGNDPGWVATADLNNDTLLDLVAAASNGFNRYVLCGKGGGVFGNYLSFFTGGSRIGVAIGDVNNDARPDLVVGGSTNYWTNVVLFNCTSVIISNSTNVSCNGGNDGTATAIVAFGTPPYTYSWSTAPVQTTATATGLSFGNYTCTVTDAISTVTSNTVAITQPTALTTSLSVTNATTCNGTNGQITAIVGGGTSPYSYSWSNGGSTQTISGLAQGTYTLTLTDAKGCTKISSALVIGNSTLSAVATHTNVACYGDTTGIASVTVSNGTPPYTYSWNNGATTQTITGLLPGSYTVTVTDANTCMKVSATTLGQATAITTTMTVTDASSCSASDGTVKANVNGGNFPWTYLWSPTGQTTQTASNLATGGYTVTITDNNGCTRIDSAIVNCTPTGIIEYNSPAIVIAPNPSNRIFSIQSLEKILAVEIINVMGKKIFVRDDGQGASGGGNSQLPQSTQLIINLSEAPSGIYFVKVQTGGGIAVKKVLINK